MKNIKAAQYKKPHNSYFAASNGGNGFISYFDQIFENSLFQRVYVLKGGPGTGKSSLMKKAAVICEELGHGYEQILCSSDPESLDGIIIDKNGKNIAIIDGTAPHVREAMAPGAVDEIINLGSSWDESMLVQKRDSIIRLINEKKHTYTSAYTFLKCAYVLTSRKQELIRACIDEEKLKKAIARLLTIKTGDVKTTKIKYKLKNAISVNGPCQSNVYEQSYKETIAVYGAHGSSFAVFDEIKKQLTDRVSSLTISPTPLCKYTLDAIGIEDMGRSFFDSGKEHYDKDIKAINSERFLNQTKLKEIKPELRMLSRQCEDAMDNAYLMLTKAKDAHFKLEEIYVEAMDFTKKERMETELFDKIFN